MPAHDLPPGFIDENAGLPAYRDDAAPPEGESQKPDVFIQWKGTDACFDFSCECGASHHFDGYFAYYVKCGACGTVWQMPTHLYPQKADPASEPVVLLDHRQEDE